MKVNASGTLRIADENTSEEVDYFFVNDQNGETYFDGDTVPAGKYWLIVTSYSETPAAYQLTLSGLNMTVDTTLPSLNVTNPSTRDVRLPKTGSLTMSGSAADASIIYYTVDGSNITTLGTTSFSKTISLPVGYHTVEIAAQETSGNYIVKGYDVMAPGVKRIDGADRYAVSANISKQNYPYGTDTIVLARGDLFTDALSGGPLAALEMAPVLLTSPTKLPTTVLDEIQRLQPANAIILGGTDSVSINIQNQLESMGIETERIDGRDRFEVSVNVAKKMKTILTEYGMEMDQAFVASGLIFSDALSASSPAGQLSYPILQASQDRLPASVETFVQESGINHFYMVGGADTVSDNVKAKLAQYGSVERIEGANRFEVGVNLVKKFHDPEMGIMDPRTLVFANGLKFPDALSGAPFAANLYAPIMLTPANRVEPSVKAMLESAEYGHQDLIYVLGGVDSVDSNVENYLKSIID